MKDGGMQVSVTRDVFRLAQVFTISRGSRTEAQVLTVQSRDGGVTGGANACPMPAMARRWSP